MLYYYGRGLSDAGMLIEKLFQESMFPLQQLRLGSNPHLSGIESIGVQVEHSSQSGYRTQRFELRVHVPQFSSLVEPPGHLGQIGIM